MKKKLLNVLMVVAAVGLLGGCDNSTSGTANATDGGKVLNIHCWNTEFEGRFRHYCKDMLSNTQEDDASYDSAVTDKKWAMPDSDGNFTMKDGTKVVFKITDNADSAYQNALDNSLLGQDQAATDDKVDMFLYEADYALKYVNSSMSCDVVDDIGLTEDEMSDMYDYTKSIATDTNKNLKGVSWQATPGLFAYRRDYAKKVLGTDDPTTVQTYLSDWDKFDATAKTMKDNDLCMLSGYDDAYRAFSNNVSSPWVNSNKEIVVDPQITNWITRTKDYSDKGYNNGTTLWKDPWAADQTQAGKVFGFFYSTWGINFTLSGYAGDDGYGNWAVCKGPASYYWGGTWLGAAKGTDNKSQIKEIMERMTCDSATAKQISLDTLDYTNNKTAMNAIANDTTYGAGFLGGQNHFKLFAETAADINMDNISAYDQGLNENIQSSMRDYFIGKSTLDEAWTAFYDKIKTVYPALTKKA